MNDTHRKALLLRPLVAIVLGLAAASASAQASPKEPARAPGYEQQFQAAQQLARTGQREEAIRAYTEMIARWPNNSDLLLGRGLLYSWTKRYDAAVTDLRAAAAVSPRRADVWSALGNAYQWSGRPRDAAEAYSRWIDLAPHDAEARLARGRAYRDAGDYDAARADFEAAQADGADAKQVETYLASLTRRAQPEAQVPPGYRWSALAGGNWTSFSGGRASWSDYTTSLRRHFDHGSLALELLDAEHFGSRDNAWALDGYVDLWPRAYANLRVQQNPSGNVLPDAYRVEIWQGLGKGWEPSVSYDRLDFNGSGVNLYGIGIGRYTGPFYLRWKHLFTQSSTSHGNSDQLLGRWYYAGNGDDYAELRGGFGVSTQDVLGTPGATANRRSTSVSAAVVRYFSPHWGGKLGVGYGDESGGVSAHEIGVTLYVRW